MGRIFEVRAQSGERVHSFGARQDRAQAQELLDSSRARAEAVGGHKDRYWIEEVDTTGLVRNPDPADAS